MYANYFDVYFVILFYAHYTQLIKAKLKKIIVKITIKNAEQLFNIKWNKEQI